MKIDYVLDCGMNTATLYNAKTGEVKTIRHYDLLNLPGDLPRGSTIMCEYAHLGCPRKKRSLSQPFEAHLLLDLYKRFEEHDITLKLFPQQSTPRAVNYTTSKKLGEWSMSDESGSEYILGEIWGKDDERDPESLHTLQSDFPEISLMNPPKSFELSDKRAESYEWVADSNMYLNIARRYSYVKGQGDEGDKGDDFLVQNMQQVYEAVSETCRSAFGLGVYKSNRGEVKKGQINLKKMKKAQVYSVLTQLLDADGKPRVRESTGKLPSWKFIKRYSIKMTPFHFKGGVARSNLYYHGARHWVSAQMAEELGVTSKSIKKKRRGGYINNDNKKNPKYVEGFNEEENRLFIKYRTQYCNAVRELFRAFKVIIEKDGVQTSIPKVADSAV